MTLKIPKLAYFGMIFPIIFIVRGVLDPDSLIGGIFLGFVSTILIFGIAFLNTKRDFHKNADSEKLWKTMRVFHSKSEKILYVKQENATFHLRHHGLFHQIFYNAGCFSLLFLLFLMDFYVFILLPIQNFRSVMGVITVMIITIILSAVIYALYIYELRIYSIYGNEEFSDLHSFIEKKLRNYRIHRYDEIEKIEFWNETVIISIKNDTMFYYLGNIEEKRQFIDFFRNKTNLPWLNKDGNPVMP